MGQGVIRAVVLLVEDESQVRTLLQKVLEIEGHTVMPAKDGEEALQMARAYPGRIDVLLTDVNMNRMDGFTLLDQLRAERPDIKALIVSGKSAAELVAEDRGLPFLTKPLFPSVLQQKLRQVLKSDNSPVELL